MFVVIEGGDATGKHTLSTKLHEWALQKGHHSYKHGRSV